MKYALQNEALRQLKLAVEHFEAQMGYYEGKDGQFGGLSGYEQKSVAHILSVLGELKEEFQNWEFRSYIGYLHNKVVPCLRKDLPENIYQSDEN